MADVKHDDHNTIKELQGQYNDLQCEVIAANSRLKAVRSALMNVDNGSRLTNDELCGVAFIVSDVIDVLSKAIV